MSNTPCEANSVIACVDGSKHTQVVLDASLWCAKQLQAPIGLLHAHDKQQTKDNNDYSGILGFGSNRELLEKMVEQDAERNVILREHGSLLLKEAKEYLQTRCDQGIYHPNVYKLHRHETLKNSIKNLPSDVQLIVLGQKGNDEHNEGEHIGHQLESAIRSSHCPALIVTERFSKPKTALYAFDNRNLTLEGISWLAEHPMFNKTHIHIVFVADDNEENKELLRSAGAKLKQHGLNVSKKLLSGDPKTALINYQKQQELDMLIMGAYGHSRLYEMFMGSTTHHILEHNLKSILMMRF